LLSAPKVPNDLPIDEALRKDPDFRKLYDYIMDLRELSSALHRGDLQKFVYGKGFILANLKALQSNLRHLTWQTKKVAEGDFSQKVDFLGEFSDSFNEMTIKLRDVNEQLSKLANFDALTQIPNRLALDLFLDSTFKEAKEKSGHLSVLLFDVDRFKRVNDTYGHSAGDQVLIAVSEILNKQFRTGDILGRHGGEEFMAVLPDLDINTAVIISSRALKAVEKAVIKVDSGHELLITVSAGVSAIKPEDTSYEDIVKRSDKALYEAKNTGRNRVCMVD